jgi:hypothetical protein
MRLALFFFLFFFLSNCSKPKSVLICGDHACVNKAEAEQYFEENLSIEIKIIDPKDDVQIDLVTLNLKENSNGTRNVNLTKKNNTSTNLKVLSNKQKKIIIKDIKKKKYKKKISKKIIKKEKVKINKNKFNTETEIQYKRVNKNSNNAVDVCTILDKCSIDEISKYLLKSGKKKGFPDITTRE